MLPNAAPLSPPAASNPDRVVRPGFALQDCAATSSDLVAAQHREHHCRIGRRYCGCDQQGDIPSQPESQVQQDATTCSGQKGAEHSEDDDRHQRGSQASPSDVPAAIEKDQDERHRDGLLDRALRRGRDSGNQLHSYGSGGQHPHRRRYSQPRR
jgi:hypothetical protein